MTAPLRAGHPRVVAPPPPARPAGPCGSPSTSDTASTCHRPSTPFSAVGPPVLEPEARARDQVARRRRDQDVARSPQRHHAGPDHHRDAPELVPDLLAFAEVDAGADLDAQLTHRLGRGTRASDRGRRLGEAREEAVAGCIELFASRTASAPGGRSRDGGRSTPSIVHPRGDWPPPWSPRCR